MAVAAAERAPSLATPRVQCPRRQVEYYFSASNLQKDFFLRRHIEADAHGFVALELLNSFPQSSLVKPAPLTLSRWLRWHASVCLFKSPHLSI